MEHPQDKRGTEGAVGEFVARSQDSTIAMPTEFAECNARFHAIAACADVDLLQQDLSTEPCDSAVDFEADRIRRSMEQAVLFPEPQPASFKRRRSM